MSKKIRFSIIGTSSIASAHINAIQTNPKAELIYIYSRDMKRSEGFSKNYRLIPVRRYEDILNDKSIDAVDIVTEPGRHANLAIEAIKNGKHVLIEKPIDTDIILAEKLMIAASMSPTVTSVISQKRFDPKIIKMKIELDNNIIGKPYLVEVKLIWKRTNEYYNKTNRWRSREGNVLINQAIHWIDIALWFFGIPTRIKSLTTKIKKDIVCYDTAICCVEFPNNLLFNLISSTAANHNRQDEFRIYGTEGILDYNLRKNSRFRFINSILNKTINFFKPQRTPLQCQIDDFIDSIINKRPPSVSVQDAYNTLKIVKSCEEESLKAKIQDI